VVSIDEVLFEVVPGTQRLVHGFPFGDLVLEFTLLLELAEMADK
jgi:hypothetical protein